MKAKRDTPRQQKEEEKFAVYLTMNDCSKINNKQISLKRFSLRIAAKLKFLCVVTFTRLLLLKSYFKVSFLLV